MDKLEFATAIGNKIIEGQHDFFDAGNDDDLAHITNIKRIIVAISEYLRSEGLPRDEISTAADNLRDHFKDLFLNSCCAKTREDEKMVREESGNWFDYIYEHEKYPE